MYNNKPLIIQRRPWYRHPIFPWGWYSMIQDKVNLEYMNADGYYIPNDGGGGEFRSIPSSTQPDNGGSYCGTIFSTEINGKLFRQHEGVEWFGRKDYE